MFSPQRFWHRYPKKERLVLCRLIEVADRLRAPPGGVGRFSGDVAQQSGKVRQLLVLLGLGRPDEKGRLRRLLGTGIEGWGYGL